MSGWSRYLKNARKHSIFALEHLSLGFGSLWGCWKLGMSKHMKPSPWRWFWNNVRTRYFENDTFLSIILPTRRATSLAKPLDKISQKFDGRRNQNNCGWLFRAVRTGGMKDLSGNCLRREYESERFSHHRCAAEQRISQRTCCTMCYRHSCPSERWLAREISGNETILFRPSVVSS